MHALKVFYFCKISYRRLHYGREILNQSINQSNFYSANITDEARLSDNTLLNCYNQTVVIIIT